VPRNNSSQTNSPPRNRSRATRAVSMQQRSGSVDAAADMSASTDAGTSASDAPSPTYDEIAEAAYHRYLSRGGVDGQDFDDWLEAERELRERRTQ